ncbi:gas vesicle protein [Streptomyces sp. NPDC026589]|uniref:gas vesicle protein n=1 Tax=Streptomyces sp. NPDC026589 TaxID=3155609 RepID=UPI0033EF1302
MTDLDFRQGGPPANGPQTTNLADILERVLDKGIVIAGDIKIDLLDIELLTIRLRLFVASVDTAKKAGIDWWETDPALSSRASRNALEDENRRLRERLQALEPGTDEDADADENPGPRPNRNADRNDSKETGQR